MVKDLCCAENMTAMVSSGLNHLFLLLKAKKNKASVPACMKSSAKTLLVFIEIKEYNYYTLKY